jgi:hypothetical protein
MAPFEGAVQVVAYFELLSRHLPLGTKKNHGNLSHKHFHLRQPVPYK